MELESAIGGTHVRDASTSDGHDRLEGRILVVGPSEPEVDGYVECLSAIHPSVERVSHDRFRDRFDSDVTIVVYPVDSHEDFSNGLLHTVRSRNPSCRVLVITDDTVGHDCLTVDIDGLLLRPVADSALQDRVSALAIRAAYHRRLTQFYDLVAAKAALETDDVAVSGDFPGELEAAIESAKASVGASLEQLSTLEGYPAVFDALGTEEMSE